ncbi:uncharacterized protein LOC130995657 [Salvia miltiorrhiza]|uniref:uncharacterized protein LOC130995657 n=1 Tax=Salvia miltiorrhiza TaxID=226208 RepID=UPI0025AB6E31|nr:uncharacterized protein LOC130995657 [Salvia miltiorrhiza]
MSVNENSSVDSDSSSDVSHSNELDEWEERVYQQNRQLDSIIQNMIINNHNRIVGNQIPTANRRYCDREREFGAERLINDYFSDSPTYTPEIFQRRFRMQKSLFIRIVEAVTANDEFFQQRRDATGRVGLSSLQKCTGAMRVLAYGTSSDVVDEYLRMSSSSTRDALVHFVEGVISCFGGTYLRRPNEQDLARLLYVGEQRGFPGMIGSIDCMHWEWKNCPNAWAGQYTGRSEKPTIILEAVASYDLWIWHAFFGTPGSCNDINVLHRSPVFNDVLEGRAPKVNYVVNGRHYDMAYYLTDGIYPSWAVFVKSITSPQIRKHKLFAQHQESVRKDVERAFGVLQARFAFLRRPCLVWDKVLMGKIMMACIIMHNMIVEDERDTYQNYYDPIEFFMDTPTRVQTEDGEHFRYSTERIASLSTYMTNRDQLRNREAHRTLQCDLIEHVWEKFGTGN